MTNSTGTAGIALASSLPECCPRFDSRLDHHGRYGEAQTPQESMEGQGGTVEYSIGGGSDQRIANQEAEHDASAFFGALLVDDALGERFPATLGRAKSDGGNTRPRRESDCACGFVFPESWRDEHCAHNQHGAKHASQSALVEGLKGQVGKGKFV